MRRLYLLRHAKSSWDDPELADRERPLSKRGRGAADRLAAYAKRERIEPELVLCSPARRTRETLERILPAFPPDVQVAFEEELYLAGGEELLERVRHVDDDVGSVLLVGHNPGIEHLLALLTGPEGRPHIGERLPTGALATLKVDGGWQTMQRGRLVDYVVPRQLGDP